MKLPFVANVGALWVYSSPDWSVSNGRSRTIRNVSCHSGSRQNVCCHTKMIVVVSISYKSFPFSSVVFENKVRVCHFDQFGGSFRSVEVVSARRQSPSLCLRLRACRLRELVGVSTCSFLSDKLHLFNSLIKEQFSLW
jgi:hypothetical protein